MQDAKACREDESSERRASKPTTEPQGSVTQSHQE